MSATTCYIYYRATNYEEYYVDTYSSLEKATQACKVKNAEMNKFLKQKGAAYFVKKP